MKGAVWGNDWNVWARKRIERKGGETEFFWEGGREAGKKFLISN